MAQVTLNASEAVFIDETAATTNFEGSADQLDIGELAGGTNKRRSLIQWDLSSIPSNATITAVTFKIYDRGGDLSSNDRTFDIFRVRRNWVENEVTWNVYSSGNSWSTAGAGNTTDDREGTAIGSVATTNAAISAAYVTCSLTASAIQDWVTGAFTNNGVICVMQTESDDMHRYDGEDNSNPPQLVIDYDLPSGGFYHISI